VASYLLLTLYDVLALRLIGRPLPYRTAALASFASYTLSHNLGLAVVTGGSARLRIYTAAGLSAADVARVILTTGVAFWAGVLTATAAAVMLRTTALKVDGWTIPPAWLHPLGAVLLVLLVAIQAWGARKGALRLFGFTLPIAHGRQAVAQLIVAVADVAMACAALLVLLPGFGLAHFGTFFLAYALAMVIALVTHVPGGLGVFEAVLVATLPRTPAGDLVAALIAYRLIYYWIPLAVALALMAWHEGRRWTLRPRRGAVNPPLPSGAESRLTSRDHGEGRP
jgi:phosphatidylglycerol lysyltransferase